MCRSRRQRKMFYLHCTDRGCTILFSCPSSQTSRHGGRNPMVQRPGRLRPEDCWSPGAGGQHGNIGRLCLQSKQANKPTPNMLQGIFLWPGGRWESFGREKNLQVTQISFVKCFEMALRIAAQILQSNERKNIVLSQFSVRGTKDLIPMGGHGLRVQAQNAVNGHQQWIRGSEQMKIQVHHFPHADGVPERLTVPTANCSVCPRTSVLIRTEKIQMQFS